MSAPSAVLRSIGQSQPFNSYGATLITVALSRPNNSPKRVSCHKSRATSITGVFSQQEQFARGMWALVSQAMLALLTGSVPPQERKV